VSWHARLLLLRPEAVQARLDALADSRRVPHVPNLWQIELGVLRMWHRSLFRSDTFGLCDDHPVRGTWRARGLRRRPVRFLFLLAEGSVVPWDLSGLRSSDRRLIRHLLGAHHDRTQFVYDLQLLTVHPGGLDALEEALGAVVRGDDPRAAWLRDLCVYEHYHDELWEGLQRFRAADEGGATELDPRDADDPDISLWAYLRWCASLPPTPRATVRALRRRVA
jgi:hypothetical protein